MGTRVNRNSRKKPSKGILFGIPLLLFISAVALLSAAAWGYVKQAFFLYDIIVMDTYKPGDAGTKAGKIIFPKRGEAYGNLSISSAGIDSKVIFGDGDKELLRGIGHFDGSMFPGEGGNVVLAGHRETVFKNLGKVKKNDSIIFTTNYGKYVYKVSQIKIVPAYDETITAPADKEQITLYTCYPFNAIGNTSERYVVIGELVEGKSIKDAVDGGTR